MYRKVRFIRAISGERISCSHLSVMINALLSLSLAAVDVSTVRLPLMRAFGAARPQARTLVVAFSSLGWDGLVKPEWASTLCSAAGTIDVVHALDYAQSWFMTNPTSGEFDDGAWWDASLEELCAPYDQVCLLGESMGGTAALRFARHATQSAIALVPQIDLRDFVCCSRTDFADARKVKLMHDIEAAIAETTSAHIILHVGRDADDLHQLNHLPSVKKLFGDSSDGSEVATAADAPLPRDGVTSSHTMRAELGAGQLLVVKHDVEGHALGAGLKGQGSLERIILADILPMSRRRVGSGPCIQLDPQPQSSTRIEVSEGTCWAAHAAEALEVHGYCVLAAPPSAEPLVPLVVCAACRHAIEARLDELLRRVLRRGVEPSDEFRFREVVHREGLRYDVPIEWTCTDRWGRANDAVDDDDDAKAAFVRAFARLHVATDVVARAALAAVVSRAADERFPSVCEVPKAGCVISHPRASAQTWHSDGDEPGLFNAFVPLLSLTAANGPTELLPGTHLGPGRGGYVEPRTAPLVQAGELLLFDYRVRHRGLANGSDEPRPVAYVTYAIGAARDRNFPDALT